MKRYLDLSPTMDNAIEKKVALVERNTSPNGISFVNSVAVAKKSPNDLVELAMEIQKADNFVNATACSKLKVIANQVRFLHNQAQNILLEVKRNNELNHAACNFKKMPGNTYHLYKRSSGQTYFSMLSPEEWIKAPHEFLGSYRLEADYSWTPKDKIEDTDFEYQILNKMLNSAEQINLAQAITESPMEI